jgi:hypothetical protein
MMVTSEGELMMRIRQTFYLALAGAMVAACDTRDDTATTQPGDELGPLPAEQPRDLAVSTTQFQATQDAGGLQVQGMAELRQRGATMNDGLELRVNLTGLSEGDHAWHIHGGTCQSPGQVLIPISGIGDRSGIGSDLNADSNGRAEASVNIDHDHLMQLQQGQSYIVNVHLRGGDNPGPAIACAPLETNNLQWTGMGTGMPGQPGAPGTGTTGTGARTGTGY